MTQFVLPEKPKRLKKKATPPRKTNFAILPLRALTDKRLTDRNRTILAMMASFANRAGMTWVTQKRIGQEFGITNQAVNKVVKKLRDAGYLEKLSGHQQGIKGTTYRVVFDPKISAQDAIAIAGNGQELDQYYAEETHQEDPVNNFTHNGPRSLGDILKEVQMPRRKQQGKPQEVGEAPKVGRAEDYTREFSQTVRQVCGVERLPNEQDQRIAAELATAGVPLHLFKAALLESLVWHRDTGKQPPAGLGYYRQAALSLVQG